MAKILEKMVAAIDNWRQGPEMRLPAANEECYGFKGYATVTIIAGEYAGRKGMIIGFPNTNRAPTNVNKLKVDVQVGKDGGPAPKPQWIAVADLSKPV